ncbi:hypothetical protein HUA76_36640 [Myxococcus sp. CA056]|uniref:hypothetical protein n=1 Tax=Myxococcus sp. CA056 TaxID=2741740 RepID=UPI00157A31D7|nr:hypothetical protein [Myxococcus sp. CA056]NTX16312.1 hypothetical protein [Myxococcus sp. CA056]
MRPQSSGSVLLRTAVVCVFSFFLARCASDPPDEACDAGCQAGEVCQDGSCIDEACQGVSCPEGQACADGACVDVVPTGTVEALAGPKRDNGEMCISGMDCLSGLCADGVCCNKACGGACDACDLPGLEGVCTVRSAGAACDDGNACTLAETCNGQSASGCVGTALTCNSPPSPCHVSAGTCSGGTCSYSLRPVGAACPEDGNPCTADACDAVGACLHPPVAAGTSCGAGSVCGGAAQCVAGCWIDGALHAPGATNPSGACQVCEPGLSSTEWSFKSAGTLCRGAAGVCDAAETCTGSSAQCPGDNAVANGTTCGTAQSGGWSTCGGFSGECGESGSRSRDVTTYACSSGQCQASTATQSEGCARTTSGNSCGPGSGTGNWGACGGFSGTCGESGSQSRSVTNYACSSGSCQGSSSTESRGCSRDTDGLSCGSGGASGWSSCSFSSTCAQSGTQQRTVSSHVCSGGACGSDSYVESRSCGRVTEGSWCGPEYSSYVWSDCAGFSDVCDSGGTQSMQFMREKCQSEQCSPTYYSNSRACSRSTNGTSCGGSSVGGWSECAGFDNDCDPTGTQSRSVSSAVCSNDSCQSANTTETQSCWRNTPAFHHLCNGVCINIYNDNMNCGGCGVQCDVPTYQCAGLSCERVCGDVWCLSSQPLPPKPM